MTLIYSFTGTPLRATRSPVPPEGGGCHYCAVPPAASVRMMRTHSTSDW